MIEFNIEDVEELDLSLDFGIKEITPPLEDLEVTPSKEEQVLNHDNSYGYDKVIVKPIPSEYIIPNGTLDVATNGDIDVTTFKTARVGVYTPPKLQDKSITITENGTQNITFDNEYDGLNNVEVITNIEGVSGKYAPRYIAFRGYTGTELNEEIANLDTSNITNMTSMFNGCSSLQTLDLSNFNMSKSSDFGNMFYGCTSLTSLILPRAFPNVMSFTYAFYNCSKLKSIDMKSVEFMNGISNMFYGCTLLETIDMSNTEITKSIDMQRAFQNCKALKLLDIRKIDFVTYCKNSANMLLNVPTTVEIIVANDTQKNWFATNFSTYTNVKTVEEV